MPTPCGIHIFGASGSGTTSLGAALGARLGIKHLDTDDYYWQLTDPPFMAKHPPEDRIRNIQADTQGLSAWILSGSLCSWGDPLLPRFRLAVFLTLDPGIRMLRLGEREQLRYGDRIKPAGDMYEEHLKFMAWAESYDTAKAPVRSLSLHTQWMKNLSCPIIRLDSVEPMEKLVEKIVRVDA